MVHSPDAGPLPSHRRLLAGLRAVPTLLLTGLTLWGGVRVLQGDAGGDTLLYVAGVLWVLLGLLTLVVRTVTIFPDSAAHFLQNIGLVPATSGLSAIEAMAARGRYAEAAEAYLARSHDPRVATEAMIRRASLLAEALGVPGSAARELTLFRDGRTLTPGEDLWIGRTLVDLYDGPLKRPGRAMVELRRLLDRYPRSAEAPRLRIMLESLREERFEISPEPPSPTTPSAP